MDIIELTTENFDQVVEENNLLVIYFWAEWCGPCKSFASVYEEVAKQFPQVLFAKVNIEKESQLADDFNVRSVPMLIILRENIAVCVESGTLPTSVLADLVAQAQALDMQALREQLVSEQNNS